MADYNQGRRFGNASGQAGAFGFSGFGGQTAGAASNPFGTQTTSTSSPFGGAQSNNAFGNTNTGGGLFGQANKPATGSLFGTNNTSTSQPASGLFGTSNNTNTGFGGFGTQQQEQPKTGFSFGNNANTGTGFGSGGTGFGTNNTANTGGGGLFGNNNNQNNTGFGSGQQQPPASNPFGGFGTNTQTQNQPNNNSAFGAFGQNNQQKPGGLFGNNASTNTGGGLFGNTANNQQQQQPAGGLFGNNNNQQQSGTSVFNKPASSGTGLFGNNNTTNTNSAGGLFGGGLGNNANQGQQNQGGGLFGNNNQQQQQPGNAFGGPPSTVGGLFGNSSNTQQQPAGASLFGSAAAANNQQQQQPGGIFGNSGNNASMLNTSQQQQNALLPPQTLTASLLDKFPYGSASIFEGLPPPPQPSPGPMATPISATKPARKSAIPPTYKINPNQSTSRLVTPRRPTGGYGFTYSTYGTPSSVGSNISTPGGFSSSLLHSSISRGLGKSLSTSNLRRSFDNDNESILSPGAFSAGSSRFSGAGSLKRLNIDRSLRTDLFGNAGGAALPSPEKNDQSKQAGILKKKVSFDTNTVGGNDNGQNGSVSSGTTASDVTNTAQPSAQEQGFLRSSSRGSTKLGGMKAGNVSSQPEMEQVKGNELAIVHEDGPPEATTPANDRPTGQVSHEDPQPGQYYTRPSKAELDKMSPEEKAKITDFEVGREGCGHVIFNEPVNLNNVNLDDIPDNIAQITLRSLTIYPDSTKKPPVGKGLNVPSTIYLENSWPRQKDRRTPSYEKSGLRFSRHIEKLRKVPGTNFVRYEADTGVWVFRVPHFTTYALDYEDTASEGDTLQTSTMSMEPNTPTPKLRPAQRDSSSSIVTSLQSSTASTEPISHTSSGPDDTFEFRKKKLFPGAFDDSAAVYDDEDMEHAYESEEPFLQDGLAASPSESGVDEPSEIQDVTDEVENGNLMIRGEEMDMAGSFPETEVHEPKATMIDSMIMAKPMLNASLYDTNAQSTPRRLEFNPTGDWADELQRTISPHKQDRQALRENQAHIGQDLDNECNETANVNPASVGAGKDLATSIDLMNSIFGKEQARKGRRETKQSSKGKGFEV